MNGNASYWATTLTTYGSAAHETVAIKASSLEEAEAALRKAFGTLKSVGSLYRIDAFGVRLCNFVIGE